MNSTDRRDDRRWVGKREIIRNWIVIEAINSLSMATNHLFVVMFTSTRTPNG